MLRHWVLLGVILTCFFVVFVPGVLWLLDKSFSNMLGQWLFCGC